MKHFFNVMYGPFLIKTCGFSFYLSCFELKEEEAITEISKKETEPIAWIKLLSHWNPGACYLQVQSDQDSSSVPGTVANWF